METAEPPAAEVMVPFGRVGTLVSQLTHDVRNRLSGLQLQSAYVAELLTDPKDAEDARRELKRLRGLIEDYAKTLQRFSARFRVAPPERVPYGVKIFTADFRRHLEKTQPDFAAQVAWTEELADESIAVDPAMIFAALGEFFQNAAHFQESGGPVAAHARAADGRFQIELRECRTTLPSAPATWGREPLVSTRPGGYGLGIFYARRLLAAHGGGVEFTHDPASARLTTRIFLPLAA